MIFNLLNRATVPSFSLLMFYYQIDVLGFSEGFMSNMTTVSYLGLGIGSFVYAKFMTDINFKVIIRYGLLLLTGISMIDLILVFRLYKDMNIAPEYIVVIITLFGNIADFTIKTMPTLVIGSLLCPKGNEATLFTMFNSMNNIGISISSLLGPAIADSLNIHDPSDPNI